MSDTEPGKYLLNILSILQVLSDRLLKTTLWDRYYHYPHFTDEGSEAQRSNLSKVTVIKKKVK